MSFYQTQSAFGRTPSESMYAQDDVSAGNAERGEKIYQKECASVTVTRGREMVELRICFSQNRGI